MTADAAAIPQTWAAQAHQRIGFRTSPLEAQVGNTPLVDLSAFTGNPKVRLLAKTEWTNPGRSVKDRPALQIVNDAILRGDLRPGVALLDATSGNTGIAYAWLGAGKGFDVHLTISEGVSPERLRILRALGAHLHFTDPAETSDGAIERARELARDEPGRYYYADQYGNPSNVLAHERTTGPEIWRQTDGRVTHFVAGLGTSGTLVGTGGYLKRRQRDVRLVGVQPDGALHGLEGLKHMDSAIVPSLYDHSLIDQQVQAATEDAYAACRTLAREAGLLVGVSAGAAFHAALDVARNLDAGTVVTLFPDGADKYLSQPFWESS